VGSKTAFSSEIASVLFWTVGVRTSGNRCWVNPVPGKYHAVLEAGVAAGKTLKVVFILDGFQVRDTSSAIRCCQAEGCTYIGLLSEETLLRQDERSEVAYTTVREVYAARVALNIMQSLVVRYFSYEIQYSQCSEHFSIASSHPR